MEPHTPTEAGQIECGLCGRDFDPDYSPAPDLCQPCAELTP